jgi:HEPN domain-containing protein
LPKRRPYLERATLERAAANLRKTTQLFEMREYSMTVVRATTVVEVCLHGILHDRMTHIFRDRRLVGTILRRLAPDEKYTWLMKELFGFSLSELCPEAVRGLPDIRQERNDVVHRGTFSRKATAERAMNLAVSIVREVKGALKIKRG